MVSSQEVHSSSISCWLYDTPQTFQFSFKLFTLKCIKIGNQKNNVSVISLMIFYESRNTFMYKVIGAVIYTIITEYICLDFLVLIQEN